MELKTYTCNHCKNTFSETLSIKESIKDLVRVKRCPVCRNIISEGIFTNTPTESSGPR